MSAVKHRDCLWPLEANEALQVQRYCLLLPEEQLLAQLNAAKCFTNAHGRSGSWHTCPAEGKRSKHKELRALVSPFRHCYLSVLPFGVDSGPGHLSRCLSCCWMHLGGVIIKKMIFRCMWVGGGFCRGSRKLARCWVKSGRLPKQNTGQNRRMGRQRAAQRPVCAESDPTARWATVQRQRRIHRCGFIRG